MLRFAICYVVIRAEKAADMIKEDARVGAVAKIKFDGAQFRRDIAAKAL